MLIEKANHAQTQVQLVPYCGMVNPEHMNQMNCVPMVMMDNDDDENLEISYLEKLFLEDFLRKSNEFRQTEQIDSLPIEIRLGTVYTYQNRRQQNQYPDSLYCQNLSVDSLRNEERRARDDKHFLITFNKNKGINDIDQFEHELTCTGFRETHNQQLTYRLYLCYEKKRLILELKRELNDPRYFSVKRLLRYSTKFTHIDVVKSKYTSNFPKTFDDIYDIRTSIGKALDEEELHINDGYCDFLHIKDLENCVFETISCNGQFIYHFNRHLVPYFDFFQIKQTRTFDYSCMDSRFFGVRILIEQQTGYDLNSSAKTTTPCLQTNNVILAKLLSNTFTEEEAKRIWTIGAWLSDLSTRCTNRFLPANKISCRRPGRTTTHRRAVR
ncbi:unnamed protein product [Adineta steineri]|uniref:Uncharacterized protein n=1 Tax=Adineta steineri TaxID=433720 RepID=A0A814DAX9_9BILA|nr:unnamed protein product [Adineta steineri]CAF0965911.1 unnamed protein product [Adineta steineri]CAF3583610.1 unnamed protein product [Adineta steineri]CAF4070057.1 unnamed protein product [Adineta steineri]